MAVRVRGGVVVEVERGMRQRVVVSRRRHVNFALGWRRLSTHSNYSPIRRYSPSPLPYPYRTRVQASPPHAVHNVTLRRD